MLWMKFILCIELRVWLHKGIDYEIFMQLEILSWILSHCFGTIYVSVCRCGRHVSPLMSSIIYMELMVQFYRFSLIYFLTVLFHVCDCVCNIKCIFGIRIFIWEMWNICHYIYFGCTNRLHPGHINTCCRGFLLELARVS